MNKCVNIFLLFHVYIFVMQYMLHILFNNQTDWLATREIVEF